MKYHFEFVIPNGESSVDLQIPTAPMYIEGSTYSGRCRMWLKYASLPEPDARAIVQALGNQSLSLEFNTTSFNRFNLSVSGGVAGYTYLDNTKSNVNFVIPVNNETLVYDNYDMGYLFSGALVSTNYLGNALGAYPYYQTVTTDGAGAVTMRDTISLIARTDVSGMGTGGTVDIGANQQVQFISLVPVSSLPANDGLGQLSNGIHNNGIDVTNRYPNLHWLDGRNLIFGDLTKRVSMSLNGYRPSDGLQRGVALCYHNDTLTDGNCMIIGSPWGSRITANVRVNSLLANMAGNRDPVPMIGAGRFEVVIEPMVNDDPVDVSV